MANAMAPPPEEAAPMSLLCALALFQMRTPEREELTVKYGAMAKVLHPDKGGNKRAFEALYEARNVVKRFLPPPAQPQPAQQFVPQPPQPRPAQQFVPQPPQPRPAQQPVPHPQTRSPTPPPDPFPRDGRGWKQFEADPPGPRHIPTDPRHVPPVPARSSSSSTPVAAPRVPMAEQVEEHEDLMDMSRWIAAALPKCLPNLEAAGTWKPWVDAFMHTYSATLRKELSRLGAVRLERMPAHLTTPAIAKTVFLVDMFHGVPYGDPGNAYYAEIFDMAYDPRESAEYNVEKKGDILEALLGAAYCLRHKSAEPQNNVLMAIRAWVEKQVSKLLWKFGGGGYAPVAIEDPPRYLELLDAITQEGQNFIITDRQCPHCFGKAYGKALYQSKEAAEQAAWTHFTHYCH
jgi:hypothetical protein